MEGLLEEMMIKLSSVVSDLFRLSGRRILAAIAAGEQDPVKLAHLGDDRLKVSKEALQAALSDFVGLGYEISSVAIPDLLSARNRAYVELVRTLSPEGMIRVGGNTSDDASYAPAGQAVSAPKGTIVNDANFQELGSFLEATNWRLIWGLNLGSTDERQATAEAEAVSAAIKDHLVAFEIGNEPDLFGRGTGHRPTSYNYEAFLREFRRYKAAIRSRVPKAPFAGPDVAGATDWVVRFAEDERDDLRLLTHHYYRECASSCDVSYPRGSGFGFERRGS